MITDQHQMTRLLHLTINHKDYNFREAQEMKILVGNTGYQITDNFENN